MINVNNINIFKKCSKCKIDKPLSDFYNDKRATDGLTARCRKCQNISTIESRNKHIEKWRAYSNKYNATRKEAHKQYYKDNLSHIKSLVLFKKFGITYEQYNQMLEEQNGVCAICGNKETALDNQSHKIRALTVDHNHKTGKVRGLLCMNCNRCLGLLKDSTDVLQSTINYLHRNK
jgi:hypothetical protein